MVVILVKHLLRYSAVRLLLGVPTAYAYLAFLLVAVLLPAVHVLRPLLL